MKVWHGLLTARPEGSTRSIRPYTRRMSMGQRKREQQPDRLSRPATCRGGEPSVLRAVNQLLAEHGFDDFAETQCRPFYADDDGPARAGPGPLFPAAADRLLRRAWTRSAASPGGRPIR